MPNTLSAKKRVKQTGERTLRNKELRSRMRSQVRQVREAIEAGDKAKADSLLPAAHKTIDKCARKNIIHDNTAAHRKSKLTRAVNKLS